VLGHDHKAIFFRHRESVPQCAVNSVTNSRNVDQKKALFARIVELLAEQPGVRPQDVFINLLEVDKENWSFGQGFAQYVT